MILINEQKRALSFCNTWYEVGVRHYQNKDGSLTKAGAKRITILQDAIDINIRSSSSKIRAPNKMKRDYSDDPEFKPLLKIQKDEIKTHEKIITNLLSIKISNIDATSKNYKSAKENIQKMRTNQYKNLRRNIIIRSKKTQ